MSFLFGNPQQGPDQLAMAKIQAESMADMFNKMSMMCAKKCVKRYHDSDLAVGEMACVDRCVGKYMQAQEKVGQVLDQFEEQMKAQEAANASMQQRPNH